MVNDSEKNGNGLPEKSAKKTTKPITVSGNKDDVILKAATTSDVTGLGRTRQKPDLDYFFQTETRTRLLKRNPEETRTRL